MGRLQQVRGRGTALSSPRLQSPRDTTLLLGRHWEVSWDGLWALCPKRGRVSLCHTRHPVPVLEGARPGPCSLCNGVLRKSGPLQPPSEQRPEMEFPAVELGDTEILSEAERQLLIHLLCLLWRKQIGIGELLKAGSPCLVPVGWRLEGACLPQSAAGWHLQHHLLYPGLDTASELSRRGFPAPRERMLIPKCCGDISTGICL